MNYEILSLAIYAIVFISILIVLYANSLEIIELPDYSLIVTFEPKNNIYEIKKVIVMCIISALTVVILRNYLDLNELLFLTVLIGMTICDLKYKLVPERFAAMLFFIAFFSLTKEPEVLIILNKLFVMVGVIAVFVGINRLFGDIMGFADVLAYAMIGLLLGLDLFLLVFCFSMVSGAIIGGLIYWKTGNNSIAFIPYITLGFILTLLYKVTDLSEIIGRYMLLV